MARYADFSFRRTKNGRLSLKHFYTSSAIIAQWWTRDGATVSAGGVTNQEAIQALRRRIAEIKREAR